MSTDRDPVMMRSRPLSYGPMVFDRRRNFERKLSEYSGYALLGLCLVMLIGGIALLLR
jgi:hypothetical protein